MGFPKILAITAFRHFARLLMVVYTAVLFPVASAGDGFRHAVAGYEFDFPRDHGSHPDFRIEWWYFTGNVTNDQGAPFGFKLTIFRSAQAPPDSVPDAPMVANQLYIAHFAISDVENRDHEAWEVIGREGFGQAHASTKTLDVRLRDYSIKMDEEGVIHLNASQDHAGLNLRLVPEKSFVIHGKDGVHQKANIEGQASHYITFSRLNASGTLRWRNRTHDVSGLGWMDHEFGSDFLADDQAGWDWFAIQLENGYDLMVYQIRNKDGSANPYSIGSLIDPDGELTPIKGSQFSIKNTSTWTSPENGGVYPMGWHIDFPERGIFLKITPTFLEQEMVMRNYTNTAYWEGSVTIEATWEGTPTRGKGYVELVGYGSDFDLL